MEFKKYSSIENSYQKSFIEKIKLAGLEWCSFVVQEKVHGANCSFVTDGNEVKFAKRSGFVLEGENFYNSKELLARYENRIRDLFFLIKDGYDFDVKSINVFGEIFGGNYPHPEVENDNKVPTIQKGVYYLPYHDFYGFDILLNFGETEGCFYVPVFSTIKLFSRLGFVCARSLFNGTLDQCLQYPNEFQTTIPDIYGLPKIENNICEGIVIRPTYPLFFKNGARILIKSKNAKFSEKNGEKVKLQKDDNYTPELNNLIEIVEQYVTQNRLNNVISHIGEVSFPKEMGKVIGCFNKDILSDFLKDYLNEYNTLEKQEQNKIKKAVNTLSVSLIKKLYMNG